MLFAQGCRPGLLSGLPPGGGRQRIASQGFPWAIFGTDEECVLFTQGFRPGLLSGLPPGGGRQRSLPRVSLGLFRDGRGMRVVYPGLSPWAIIGAPSGRREAEIASQGFPWAIFGTDEECMLFTQGWRPGLLSELPPGVFYFAGDSVMGVMWSMGGAGMCSTLPSGQWISMSSILVTLPRPKWRRGSLLER